MGKAWEGVNEASVAATPEEVWQAIATGPGIDSWYMGRTTVEDGLVKTDVGSFVLTSDITESQEPQRFTQRSVDSPDGGFIAFEYLIEGRDQGSTVLRMVANGFLPQDDWEAEYDAMHKGGAMYWATLVAYLNYFPGRFATPVAAVVPYAGDWPSAHARLAAAFGGAAEGAKVAFTPTGLPPVEGVIDFVNDAAIGIRTPDGLFRFLKGFFGPMYAQHHLFVPGVNRKETGLAWQQWLESVLN